MKKLFIIILSSAAWAGIGDNAPSLPSTYVTTHPRLPNPDNTFLDAVWSGGSMVTRYATAASNWDSSNPTANGGLLGFRQLLIAYLSYNRNAPTNPTTATLLQKIKDMSLNAGMWAPRLYDVTDLTGSGTGFCTPNCTVSTATGNFLTGCSGGSCSGKEIAILGREFTISSIDGTGQILTLVGSNFLSPNGSNLVGAVTNSSGWGSYASSLALSIAYDWIYNQLDATSRDRFRAVLMDQLSEYEATYVLSGASPSPFNDNFYLSQSLGLFQMQTMPAALAIHDPGNVTWAAATLGHLRFAMDVFFNFQLPVWRRVIGGGCLLAENDAGTANSGTAGEPGCGGAYHEGWSDYSAGPASRSSLNNWYVTSTLSWQVATGDPIFTREGWMKNFAYWTMYNMRPDFTLERIGANRFGVMQYEHQGSSIPGLGMLDGLAQIYNDPTLRGWAKTINWANLPFDDFEPSAWPYYTPIKAADAINTRAALSKVRDFPGVGTVYMRTGWGENDTSCYFRYTPYSFWSHPVQDAGGWACFSRGALAIRSGIYVGETSLHFWRYATQAVSQNTITITDPSDRYTDETYALLNYNNTTNNSVMPNDGGQRRVGSRAGNSIISTGQQQSPADVPQWQMSAEYYRQGKQIAYAVGSGGSYTYVAADITRAYNNVFSNGAHTAAGQARQANTSNRSDRAQKVVRHFLFIPRGTAAYVVTYDQVTSTNSSFVKKNLVHFVNNPTVTAWDGNRAYWTVTRAELVTAAVTTARPDNGSWMNPFAVGWTGSGQQNINNCPSGCTTGSTQYQYAGQMYGYMTLPASGTITTVGGALHEFDITDAGGTTTNNECFPSQAECNGSTGLGSTAGIVQEDNTSGPREPGGYRIEISPASANLSDQFLNVMLFTTTTDTNVVSTMPVTTLSSGVYTTVWKDNSDTCTYTVTFPVSGVGGTITATGAGCATVI